MLHNKVASSFLLSLFSSSIIYFTAFLHFTYNFSNIHAALDCFHLGLSHQKQLMPYGRDSCFAWNRCHIFLNKRGTYGIIADDLRFATQLSNVYGNAIRAKLANAQTTRSVADPFSSFVTQNLQSICSLCHRESTLFHKDRGSDPIADP